MLYVTALAPPEWYNTLSTLSYSTAHKHMTPHEAQKYRANWFSEDRTLSWLMGKRKADVCS